MYENDKLLLEKNGWIIECESPFEIRNEETGDFASGFAAKAVLDSLKPKPKKKTCYCGSPIDYSNPDCVEFSLCKDHAMDA
jgi:hypothetical protein